MLLEITALVDARGLQSPLVLARARQMLLALDHGAVIEILVTDPDAPRDVHDWCASHGHELVEHSSDGKVHRLVVRRK